MTRRRKRSLTLSLMKPLLSHSRLEGVSPILRPGSFPILSTGHPYLKQRSYSTLMQLPVPLAPRLIRWSASSRGFSMIEIMLVVMIITVLMGSAVYFMSNNLDVARVKTAEGDIKQISTQLKLYETLNMSLPTSEQGIAALVTKPTTRPIPARWQQLMSEVPLDPWGVPYQYRNPGRRNPNSFDLYSKGPDRTEGTEDDIGNWKP